MARWSFAAELEQFGPAGSRREPLPLHRARRYCRWVARQIGCPRYFTLLGWILPAAAQQHVWNVIAYHAWVRAIVEQSPNEQLVPGLLNWWEQQLQACYRGQANHPVMVALGESIEKLGIAADPLADLLVAARQDHQRVRYHSQEQVLEYCRYAANPLGRLVLLVAGYSDEPRTRLCDALCTGWQLMIFCRDLPRHLKENRLYIPVTHCQRFGCDAQVLTAGKASEQLRRLLAAELDAAAGWLQRAWPLANLVPRSWKLPVATGVAIGLEWIEQIRAMEFDVWARPPHIPWWRMWEIVAQWWWRLRSSGRIEPPPGESSGD